MERDKKRGEHSETRKQLPGDAQSSLPPKRRRLHSLTVGDQEGHGSVDSPASRAESPAVDELERKLNGHNVANGPERRESKRQIAHGGKPADHGPVAAMEVDSTSEPSDSSAPPNGLWSVTDGKVLPHPETMTSLPLTEMSAATINPPQWQATIEKAIKAIVSIRFSQVASFDTEPAENSEASGFIVDAERGIILTNRHVVSAGPFVGEAVAHDHEEFAVSPIYRDPVHDFGFLRFDPSLVKYMNVTQIELRPDLAAVGVDIRVVGNDAGEKLSILAGSISRLDRNAPDYGELTYNDFNTFYLQAASSTSGGSSGSPVIDIEGNAVALQAGGNVRSATDFFLPLDRVKRALGFIQKGMPVPRGTMQTQFLYRPFDEARRLGLQPSTEQTLRKLFPTEIGMLVAEVVVPKGPAADLMEEGDILVSINGRYITKFVPMEEIIDANVGKKIKICVERGGKSLEFEVEVGDLHKITPDRYVEVGGAKLNELSYQLARAYCVPCEGVYVAEPAGMFKLDGTDHGWIVQSVDNKPTPNLDTFIEVMQAIPDRARVPIVFHSIADFHTTSVHVVDNERHWSSFRLVVRNDTTGLWDYTDLGDPIPPRTIEPQSARFIELSDEVGQAKDLIRSLVKVNYYMPLKIDGFPKSRKQGAGLLVDKERGLVVVSRSVVPTALGDLTITFADSIILPGKVEYLHPTHNFVFVSYDPRCLGDINLRSAPLSDKLLGQGQKVSLVAVNQNSRTFCISTVVTDITSVTIPPNNTPRFRALNFDAITLDTPIAQQCNSGVLADCDGKVQGLWLNYLGERNSNGHDNEYHLGMHIQAILPVLEPLRKGIVPQLRSLNIELMSIQIAQAVTMGLSQSWVSKVHEADTSKHQLFLIRRLEAGSESSKVLKELDLILAINGKVITRIYDMDIQYTEEVLEMTILRQKKEMTVTVPTSPISGDGTSRVVIWAGAVLQEPHKAVLQQSKTLPSRIYISGRSKGSPSYMYGMQSTMWVTHVQGIKTTNLDEFLAVVKSLPDNSYVRIKAMSFDNVPTVLSVKINLHYWPTVELTKDPVAESGWSKRVYNGQDTSIVIPLASDD